jgi:hypothetical protein
MLSFKCDIFSKGIQKKPISNSVCINMAEQWDSFVERMAERIYDALVRWLGPFSKKYPLNPKIQILSDKYRNQGVNALFEKDNGGKVYLNLDMLPLEEDEVGPKTAYTLNNLLHEFMHANLADFIYRPPDGVSPQNWFGDPIYDEGYLDFMGEIISAEPSIWQDEVFGDVADIVFAGYVASNLARLQNALGVAPGSTFSVPDFHIKRWAGQEYARKIGGSLFRRFMENKRNKYYFYPVGSGPARNYDIKVR